MEQTNNSATYASGLGKDSSVPPEIRGAMLPTLCRRATTTALAVFGDRTF